MPYRPSSKLWWVPTVALFAVVGVGSGWGLPMWVGITLGVCCLFCAYKAVESYA